MAKGGSKQKSKGGTGSANDKRGGIAKAKEQASRSGADTAGSSEGGKGGGQAKRDEGRGTSRR